jgi:hypothetical protein
LIIYSIDSHTYITEIIKVGKLPQIPAYLDDECQLIIGENGKSSSYIGKYETFRSDDFTYFDSYQYRKNAKRRILVYVRKGIPYEYYRVIDSRNGRLYSFLTLCKVGTYLCKCDICGTKFIEISTKKNRYVNTKHCEDCRDYISKSPI